MMSVLLTLAFSMQSATSPSDLPPSPPPAPTEEVDPGELKRIFVKDSSQALTVEVEHPLQQICVRRLVAGSRVKARTFCQDQTAWKAYQLAREADADAWGNARQGLVVE